VYYITLEVKMLETGGITVGECVCTTFMLGFGNNVCGNLDPSLDVVIESPTEVTIDCDEVLWLSWNGGVGRGSGIQSWGAGAYLFEYPVKRVLGIDSVIGYMCENGRIATDQRISNACWNDAVSTVSDIWAMRGRELSHYASIQQLLEDTPTNTLTHPAFADQNRLYATESKAFIQTCHNLSHVFEIVDHGLELVDDLEGLGVEKLIPGTLNRIAAVTHSGDAYLLDKGSWEPLDIDEPVRMLGVGSNFEVVVTAGRVLVRGSSESPCQPR
jgi:hypothetical protein